MKLFVPQKYYKAILLCVDPKAPEILFEFGETHYRMYTTNRHVLIVIELPYTKKDDIDDCDFDRAVVKPQNTTGDFVPVAFTPKTMIQAAAIETLNYRTPLKLIEGLDPQDGFPYIMQGVSDTINACILTLENTDPKYYAFGHQQPFMVDLKPNVKMIAMPAKNATPSLNKEAFVKVKSFFETDVTNW